MKQPLQTEQAAYLSAAEEAVRGALELLKARVYPAAAFMAIHAFESAGRAYLLDAGLTPGRSHRARMRQFAVVAASHGQGRGLMGLAATAGALRPRCLYPTELVGGAWAAPEQVVSAREAQRLTSRARGVVQLVERALS